jgi:putative hydrolase of the HAD superfamily
MIERGVIVWDFDGTLAYRECLAGFEGRSFSSCLIEALREDDPTHEVEPALLLPYLAEGFPWHTPEIPHLDIVDSEQWWRKIHQVFIRAYLAVGVSSQRASALATLAAARYVDTSSWRLYDDSLCALERLRNDGWRHIILSNHVPELRDIVNDLGLGAVIDATLTSASIGYEKPHPEAFATARRAAGEPSALWMVGDNAHADVAGAEAAGIPAILLRREEADAQVPRTVRSLDDVYLWLEESAALG